MSVCLSSSPIWAGGVQKAGHSQYLVMVGKVFHPSELLPMKWWWKENKYFILLDDTFGELHLFLLEEPFLLPRHRFLCSAFKVISKQQLNTFYSPEKMEIHFHAAPVSRYGWLEF